MRMLSSRDWEDGGGGEGFSAGACPGGTRCGICAVAWYRNKLLRLHSRRAYHMSTNLLSETFKTFDPFELRILLNEHIGGPGQYDDRATNPNRFYLPLAREACKIVLTFRDRQIISMEPGPAFDASDWERVSGQITKSILDGVKKVGREYSFSGFRVEGSWRGGRSGVQILPPPKEAPRANLEIAEHPFILEFPLLVSDFWPLTNDRRQRTQRKLSLLLDVLLAGRTSLPPRQPSSF
jgi:hypothetical protein